MAKDSANRRRGWRISQPRFSLRYIASFIERRYEIGNVSNATTAKNHAVNPATAKASSPLFTSVGFNIPTNLNSKIELNIGMVVILTEVMNSADTTNMTAVVSLDIFIINNLTQLGYLPLSR